MAKRFSFCDVRLMSNLKVESGNSRMPDDIDTRPVIDQLLPERMPKQKRRKEYLPLAKCNHKNQVPRSLEEILQPCRGQPFNCSMCTATFPTLAALNSHEVQAEHVSKLCPSWICFFCTAKEAKRGEMKEHLLKYHRCRGCKLFFHSR